MPSWTATRQYFPMHTISRSAARNQSRLLLHSYEREGDYSTSEGELQKRARIPGRLLEQDRLPQAVVQKPPGGLCQSPSLCYRWEGRLNDMPLRESFIERVLPETGADAGGPGQVAHRWALSLDCKYGYNG
jgi:hypothetical protein